MTEPRLITIPEAATLAGRSPKTIYAWIRDERLDVWENEDGIMHVRYYQIMTVRDQMTLRRNNRNTPKTDAAFENRET